MIFCQFKCTYIYGIIDAGEDQRQKNETYFENFYSNRIILVIAIVAVLAGTMVPIISRARMDAKISRLIETGETLYKSSQLFYSDTGASPADVNDLLTDTGIAGWDGPYIDKPLTNKDHPFGGLCYLGSSITISFPARIEKRYVYFGFMNIDESFAKRVNDAVDGDTGPFIWRGIGTVHYSPGFRWMSLRYNVHVFSF